MGEENGEDTGSYLEREGNLSSNMREEICGEEEGEGNGFEKLRYYKIGSLHNFCFNVLNNCS